MTKAGGPTRLSKVVAVSEVQGVEQLEVCADGWKGGAGEGAGHMLCRKESFMQAYNI
jgi:hypothetical protein